MAQAATVFALLAGGVLAIPVADKLRTPLPVLCTGWGMVVALLPAAAPPHIEPETVLALLLSPLIYASAQHTSWRQFVAHGWEILLLAIVLVFLTATAVAVTAAHLPPALPIGAAIVLGALVSPPDSAAATSVAGRLGLPRRLVTILEGEGLFNDVTALTIYQVTVYAVVTGSLTVAETLDTLVRSIVLAVAVGLVTGWIASKVLDRMPTGSARAALSLLVPFAAYLPTAELHGSGVLAVLVTALYLGHNRLVTDDATSRVTGRTFWDVIELLVICLTFGLVGLELVTIIRAVGDQAYRLVGYAGVICAVVVAVRVLWLLPMTALARRRSRPGPADEQVTADWRDTVIISWAGIRGVVTVASALALPLTTDTGAAFPGRDQIMFVAVVVVLATLIVQGVSLPWLVTWLHVKVDPVVQRAAEQRAAQIALEAALVRLDEMQSTGKLDDQIAAHAADAVQALLADIFFDDEESDAPSRAQLHRQIRVVERELLRAARSAVIAARVDHSIDGDAADRLIHRLDLRSLTAE